MSSGGYHRAGVDIHRVCPDGEGEEERTSDSEVNTIVIEQAC